MLNGGEVQVVPAARETVDMGELGGNKLIEYGEQVAKHVEGVGNHLLDMANKMKADCDQLASDVREMCRLQAERGAEVAERMRKASLDIRDARNAFMQINEA